MNCRFGYALALAKAFLFVTFSERKLVLVMGVGQLKFNLQGTSINKIMCIKQLTKF